MKRSQTLKELQVTNHHLKQSNQSLRDEAVRQKSQLKNDLEDLKEFSIKQLEIELKQSKESLVIAQKEYSDFSSKSLKQKEIVETELNGLISARDDLRQQKTIEETIVNGLLSEKRTREAEIATLTELSEHSQEELNQLRIDVDNLQVYKNELETSNLDLKSEHDSLIQNILEEKEIYEKTKAEHTKNLKELEIRETNLVIKLDTEEKSQVEVRNNLAKWQKSLEEKEQNLRIREAQIDQAGRVMRRNSQLLKL